MPTELEELIKEQAHDMRFGDSLQTLGEPWMHSCVSLDTGILENLDQDGHHYTDRGSREASFFNSCAVHGLQNMRMYEYGPRCVTCQNESFYRWRATNPERAAEIQKKYQSKPEVQARRRERLRERYQNDPEFRERRRRQDRETKARARARKAAQRG
jgi:hypothetical protein